MARRQRNDESGKRSEVVTVRLDPKLKYLAELAARKQRRPLSSYVEWAIERSLSHVHLDEDFNNTVSVADAERTHHLWDLDEADRIVRLAMTYRELLTHEEQMVWKLIRENGSLWKGKYAGDPPFLPPTDHDHASLDRAKLRGREGHCACALRKTGNEA
jgi:hypothetical protein